MLCLCRFCLQGASKQAEVVSRHCGGIAWVYGTYGTLHSVSIGEQIVLRIPWKRVAWKIFEWVHKYLNEFIYWNGRFISLDKWNMNHYRWYNMIYYDDMTFHELSPSMNTWLSKGSLFHQRDSKGRLTSTVHILDGSISSRIKPLIWMEYQWKYWFHQWEFEGLFIGLIWMIISPLLFHE